MKTVLCVPGHDEHKVKNCRKYGADLILFDLEDSVPEDKKDLAREIVATHVTTADDVRVNWNYIRDIEVLRERPLRSVWLPKDALPDVTIPWRSVIIIETPQAVYRYLSRWGDVLRLPVGLAFGAADFAAYMNVPASSPQVEYARQQVALAARALGVEAYDSPCTSLRGEVVCEESYAALLLGYDWKGVVHPSQIPEVKAAQLGIADRKLVELYDGQPEAVMEIDGEIIAPPMIRAAKKRLGLEDKDK